MAVHLAGQAIRSVALGMVVTALAQSVTGGIALALVGVPFKGNRLKGSCREQADQEVVIPGCELATQPEGEVPRFRGPLEHKCAGVHETGATSGAPTPSTEVGLGCPGFASQIAAT